MKQINVFGFVRGGQCALNVTVSGVMSSGGSNELNFIGGIINAIYY